MSEAPWTDDQVESLNQYQASGVCHPFTCGTEKCRADLVATKEGWVCPQNCGYTQQWAHAWMMDWSWKKALDALSHLGAGYEGEIPDVCQCDHDGLDHAAIAKVLGAKATCMKCGKPPNGLGGLGRPTD